MVMQAYRQNTDTLGWHPAVYGIFASVAVRFILTCIDMGPYERLHDLRRGLQTRESGFKGC